MRRTVLGSIKITLLKLFMIFVEIFCIMMVVVSIQSGEIAPIIIPFIVVPTIFSIRLLVPNYYRCMDAVRGYISYEELKRLLKGEEFHKLKLTDGTETEDVYESEHFLYAAKVYVPKGLVIGITDSSGSIFGSYDDPVNLALYNGREVTIGNYNAGPAKVLADSLHLIFTQAVCNSYVKCEFEAAGFCRHLKKIYKKHAGNKEQFEYLTGLSGCAVDENDIRVVNLVKDVAVLKYLYEIQSYMSHIKFIWLHVNKDDIAGKTIKGLYRYARCYSRGDEIFCVCGVMDKKTGERKERTLEPAGQNIWDYRKNNKLYEFVTRNAFDQILEAMELPPIAYGKNKKEAHTAKRKLRRRKGFEKTDKKELLTDAEFLAKLEEHLQQFTDLGKISINKALPQDHEQSVCQDAIPLYGLAEKKDFVGTPYQQLLKENEAEIWEKLLSDDSIECIADKIRENLPDGGTVMIYLTNDCSSFDEYYTDAFGILFELFEPYTNR